MSKELMIALAFGAFLILGWLVKRELNREPSLNERVIALETKVCQLEASAIKTNKYRLQ
jgi:hypothetical protein